MNWRWRRCPTPRSTRRGPLVARRFRASSRREFELQGSWQVEPAARVNAWYVSRTQSTLEAELKYAGRSLAVTTLALIAFPTFLLAQTELPPFQRRVRVEVSGRDELKTLLQSQVSRELRE